MKKYAGEEFLNRLYKDLVHSEEVQYTAKGGNKNEDLAIYLERLDRITKRAREHDRLDLLKKYYYDNYVIKEENVPKNYFENQERLALENGHGYVKFDDYTKNKEIEHIITEQKESMNKWLDYFCDEDTDYYPPWFKYYVFRNVMKIGFYNKSKKEFTKRTFKTTKPFIELNREAIAKLYDELYKYLNKEELADKNLNTLIENGNFAKIYSYIIQKLDSERDKKINANEGVWKKYEQGSDPKVLFNDINGKGTGWCTAGGIETAKAHLETGDFYVYYTKNEINEFACPRIAIRMEYGSIAEVRGIAEQQNLESEMESVVEEKLNEFPDKEEYKKKINDMKMLTHIYMKCQENIKLSKEDIRFLYEIDSKIIGFGFEKDPRIKEILNNRNIKYDISYALNISDREISLTREEFLANKNTKYYHGNLDLNFFTSTKDLKLPEIVNGNLYLNGLKSKENLQLPKKINGALELNGLTYAEYLILPEALGELSMEELISAENLKLPNKLDGHLFLGSLNNAKGLNLPEELNGSLFLDKLTCAKGLKLPKSFNGTLYLNGLVNGENLKLPDVVNGGLGLKGLTKAENLKLPDIIRGSLDLNGLKDTKGLSLPKQVGELWLCGLSEAKNLLLPKEINGNLHLDNLIAIAGLKLPQKLTGNLHLESLKNVKGLVLPKNEIGELYVPGKDLYCQFAKEQLINIAKTGNNSLEI